MYLIGKNYAFLKILHPFELVIIKRFRVTFLQVIQGAI